MVDNKAALNLIQRAGQLKHLAGRHDQKSHGRIANRSILHRPVPEDAVTFSGKLYHNTGVDIVERIMKTGLHPGDVGFGSPGVVFFSKVLGETEGRSLGAVVSIDVDSIRLAPRPGKFQYLQEIVKDELKQKLYSSKNEEEQDILRNKIWYSNYVAEEAARRFNALGYDGYEGDFNDIAITNLDLVHPGRITRIKHSGIIEVDGRSTDINPQWQSVTTYLGAAYSLKQDDKLPDYILALTKGTLAYEQAIKAAWIDFKRNPTEANAQKFASFLKTYSGKHWPEVVKAVLGVSTLSPQQQKMLEDALGEHHEYVMTSLLPDMLKAASADNLNAMDHRAIFLYAGALWSFGLLATVMFDGLEVRDLADLFLFAGPNDAATCKGERGCEQYAGKVFTVAQILAEQIIPGKLRCVTNCRHMLLPVASPLNKPKVPKQAMDYGQWQSEFKHLAGRHDQKSHGLRSLSVAEQPDIVNSIEDLRHYASMPPAEDEKYEYYTHAVRWGDELEAIAKNGIVTSSRTVYSSRPPLVRDRQAGFVVFRAPKGEAKHSKDVVEVGLSYDQYTFDRTIAKSDIVKIVPEVVTNSGFRIRADKLADYALRNQGLSGSEYEDLPDSYKRWFRLETVEKHQPGRHDQHSHGRMRKFGKTPTGKEPTNPLANPDSAENTEARNNWKNLSHEQKMALLDPDAINESMASTLGKYRESASFLYQFEEGQATDSTSIGQLRGNAFSYLKTLEPALTPGTRKRMAEYIDMYSKALKQALEDGSLPKGVKASDLNDMLLDNVDKMVFQESETRKRQLGDHGIRHVTGNIENSHKMLEQLEGTTGFDKLLAAQVMVDHDMGYTAGVVQKSFEATKYHELFSEKYARSEDEQYRKVFGDRTDELYTDIATHADFDLDWKGNPTLSAIRTADNLALFSRDKLPALFMDVPGATTTLYKLQLSKSVGQDAEMLPRVKEELNRLIDNTSLDERVKAELHSAAEEVMPLTGKFTLGMLAGEIEDFSYDGEKMAVELANKPEREVLNGLFDLGDRQFDKFLENYNQEGTAGEEGVDLLEKDSGERVLSVKFRDQDVPVANRELVELNDVSVRPIIHKVVGALGDNPDPELRDKVWKNLEKPLSERLTKKELADFRKRYYGTDLLGFPLSAREKAYLETEWKEKHLAGRHDQHTHGRKNVVFRDAEPYTKKKHPIPDEDLQARIRKVVAAVVSIADMDVPEFLIKQRSGEKDPIGHQTKDENGQQVVEIAMDKLTKAIEHPRPEKDFKDWFYGAERTEEGLLEHIVAHELGHAYWRQHSVKSKELVPIGKGMKARVETNPILADWQKFYNSNKYDMSGYARYYDSHTEAFADAFASFTSGTPMPSVVEDWFMENVK